MTFLENFEVMETTFQSLNEFKIPKDKKIKLNITKDGTLFEFLLFIRSESKKVIVMGSGAFDPKMFSPPIFNRHKWIDRIQESSILYNDPTLYLGKINVGWGYGDKDKHYIKEIGDILKVIYNINGLKTSSALVTVK